MSDIFDHGYDAWDDLLFNSDRYDGSEGWTRGKRRILGRPDYYRGMRCRYCDMKNLYWMNTERGYRLKQMNGNFHVCDQYKKNLMGL